MVWTVGGQAPALARWTEPVLHLTITIEALYVQRLPVAVAQQQACHGAAGRAYSKPSVAEQAEILVGKYTAVGCGAVQALCCVVALFPLSLTLNAAAP